MITDDSLAEPLMSGLSDAGVAGISLWPEGLRHPFGFEKPLTSRDDYSGQTIRSAKSEASAQLFQALGARTSAKEPNATTMVGIQGEFVLDPSGVGVSNITFFPKVNVLYANADTYTNLDAAARQVLDEAAAQTQEWAIEQTDDVGAGQAFCADGGTVVSAEKRDVETLKRATATVTDSIAAAGNAAIIDTIGELKATVGNVPTAPVCAAPVEAEHEPGQAEAKLNGTYRFTVTKQDFLDGGLTESDAYHNAGVQTYVLNNGKLHYRLDPSEHEFNKDSAGPDETDGTYQVDNSNILTFTFPAYDNEIDRLLFEAADNGDLTLTVLDGPDRSAAFTMTSKVWERIK